jgi:hypothetical protein
MHGVGTVYVDLIGSRFPRTSYSSKFWRLRSSVFNEPYERAWVVIAIAWALPKLLLSLILDEATSRLDTPMAVARRTVNHLEGRMLFIAHQISNDLQVDMIKLETWYVGNLTSSPSWACLR